MPTYADIIKAQKKAWNADDLMDGAKKSVGEKLPFSSPLLNWQTYGGIPRNKITEFFGDQGSGKSTTATDICKNAIEVFQEEWENQLEELRGDQTTKEKKLKLSELEDNGPRKVLYIDLEHSFDNHWAKVLGVDDEVIQIMQPPDVPAEDILNMILDLVETDELGLIVLDSLPSLVPRAELEKKIGERTVAALANIFTIFLRKLVPMLTRYKTTFILINQTRDNQENPYVVQTPGGRGIKFYSSLRIQFSLGNPIDFMGNELPMKTEDPAGYLVKTRMHKQKSAPFDRKNASYYLLCTEGIKPEMDYAQLAVNKYKIIRKGGPWFTVYDPYTGELLEMDDKPVKLQGMPKVYDFLETNAWYFDRLKKYIEDDINGRDQIDPDQPETFEADEEDSEVFEADILDESE